MNKKWGAVLAFAPAILAFLLIFIMIAFYGTMFLIGITEGTKTLGILILIWAVLLVIVLFALVATAIGAMITFIVLACKNKELETGLKIVWVIVLINFNAAAFPIYWWIYLRQK